MNRVSISEFRKTIFCGLGWLKNHHRSLLAAPPLAQAPATIPLDLFRQVGKGGCHKTLFFKKGKGMSDGEDARDFEFLGFLHRRRDQPGAQAIALKVSGYGQGPNLSQLTRSRLVGPIDIQRDTAHYPLVLDRDEKMFPGAFDGFDRAREEDPLGNESFHEGMDRLNVRQARAANPHRISFAKRASSWAARSSAARTWSGAVPPGRLRAARERSSEIAS